MDLRSGKSTTTSGAGKSSRDAAETVCEALTQPARATISPHSSSDQFRVWKIRFIAHINSDKPALAPGIEQDNPTLSASDNAKLAAILVGWLDSDFILELLNVVDVEKDGISMFSHICSHFQNTTSSEPSPEERVYKAIRHVHRANHDSLALFLRAVNQVSAEYASRTRSRRSSKHQSTIDKLLALHVLHELNKAAWLNALKAATTKKFRSEPDEAFSITTFNKDVLDLCPTPDHRAARHSPTPPDPDEASSKHSGVRFSDRRDRDRDRDRSMRTPQVASVIADEFDRLDLACVPQQGPYYDPYTGLMVCSDGQDDMPNINA